MKFQQTQPLAALLLLAVLFTVQAQEAGSISTDSVQTNTSFDIQGHRGARGHYPENSIPAFLYALKVGVTTLELDVAINAEGHAVVSHEPWMSASICSHEDGSVVTEAEAKKLRIYAMTDAQVKSYDCGSRGNPHHSEQTKMPTVKPLLSDLLGVVAQAETVISEKSELARPAVLFNVEIKSLPQGDLIFHPKVEEFAQILIDTLKQHSVLSRSSIQSFDARALEAVHAIDASIPTVWLIENVDGLAKNLAKLSFLPSVYSPHFSLVDADLIKSAHAQGIRVIPWTVNSEDEIHSMLKLGVDGIISDYPDRGINILAQVRDKK